MRVQEVFFLDRVECLGESQGIEDRPPRPCVPHPVNVEAIRTHMVETDERRIELNTGIIRMSGTVALDEAVAARSPVTTDVDGVVELSWLDLRQKAGLQDVGDEGFACGDDRLFFGRVRGNRAWGGGGPHSESFTCHIGLTSLTGGLGWISARAALDFGPRSRIEPSMPLRQRDEFFFVPGDHSEPPGLPIRLGLFDPVFR
jgi:hypothetical protein